MQKFISPLTGLATLFVVCISYVVKADAQSMGYYRVNRIIDGDTYEVVDSWGNLTTIRLACADTPETRRNNDRTEDANKNQLGWGNIAENRVSQLFNQSNNIIWFYPNGGKSYDRAVGDVYLTNGTFIQSTLAMEGLAMLDERYNNCNSSEQQAQTYAQFYKRGVWNDTSFIAPWLFRQR
jgi:endonuclease YncB( thermonuclease family)